MNKILYLGIERDGLTHGGEYEITKPTKAPGFIVKDDNGSEQFIDDYSCIILNEEVEK